MVSLPDTAAGGGLAQRPASGYDLLKRFQKSMAHVWPATQSQLYGELGKLADAGLIKVSDVGPRGRKEYAITDAGRAELHRWMTSPQDDPAVPQRSTSAGVPAWRAHSCAGARVFGVACAPSHTAEHARYEQIRDSKDWSGR